MLWAYLARPALVVALWSCVSVLGQYNIHQIRHDAFSELAWLETEYVLAFRVTAGVRQSAYDTYVDKFRDDDRPLARAFTPWGCRTVSGNCDRHYRSSLLNDWPSAYIDKVRLSLFVGETEVAYILFNGTNSNKDSWFSKDRVLNSSWTDLSTEPTNYFSIPGHFIGGTHWHRHSRRFYVFRNYGGCPRDNGWLSVQDQNWDVCTWGQLTSSDPYPAILYSKTNTYVNFNSADVGKADTLVIGVKFLWEDLY